jgi:hypothetical protein
MQTKDGGKHDILLVAGPPDHAGLPASLPHKSAPTCAATIPGHVPMLPSMSAEDCTAHQTPRRRARSLPFPATVEP